MSLYPYKKTAPKGGRRIGDLSLSLKNRHINRIKKLSLFFGSEKDMSDSY